MTLDALSAPSAGSTWLTPGAVIPAHPLALHPDDTVDWVSQRALSRYYVDAGAHGLAVGVHTTQFALHEDAALLADVWAQSAEIARGAGREIRLIAGVRGTRTVAQREADVAASLGYGAALLSPAPGASDADILEMARAVGEVLPAIGFYMQDDVGGRYLGEEFWRALFELPTVIGVKIAAFDRYRTGDVIRALLESGRTDIALLTGNDDSIVGDLATTYRGDVGGEDRSVGFVGGLLGQWAVGTRAAVDVSARVALAQQAGTVDSDILTVGTWITEINGALFDVRNSFAGCVAGVNELLRQQGIVRTAHCLDPLDRLSPGQQEAIEDMRHRYPDLLDEDFIAENVDRWRS
jgi:dihydrodipicolinate synthase/N-acetylneuraminate lyase